MHVIILAGGNGVRLRSLIDARPKALASIGGRPSPDEFLSYHFTLERPQQRDAPIRAVLAQEAPSYAPSPAATCANVTG